MKRGTFEAAARLGAQIHWAVPEDHAPAYAVLNQVQKRCRVRLLDEWQIDALVDLYEDARALAKTLSEPQSGMTVDRIFVTTHGGSVDQSARRRWRPMQATWAHVVSSIGNWRTTVPHWARASPLDDDGRRFRLPTTGVVIVRSVVCEEGWHWRVRLLTTQAFSRLKIGAPLPVLRGLIAKYEDPPTPLGPHDPTNYSRRRGYIWRFHSPKPP